MSACPAGIWAARAEPLRRDRITRCHISITPNTTKTDSAMLCTRLMANMTAMMFRLLNLSAKYPVKGGIRTRGIIAAKVTIPTHSDSPPVRS